MSKHRWFPISDDKLSFYTKKYVQCSRKLLRENDNVMRPNYRSVTTFCIASVNSVMTFSASKSDRNIFYKQFNFGLAPQTFGLVTSSNSLPEGQLHLFIFVSPCRVLPFLSFWCFVFEYGVLPHILAFASECKRKNPASKSLNPFLMSFLLYHQKFG